MSERSRLSEPGPPAEFDAYYKWLGISPGEQPPNHYRLLGVNLFESDAEVIANAADARMAHVKTFQTGRHSAISQRILNEVASAKVCLLNPSRKSEYDRRLRRPADATRSGPMATAAANPPELPVPALGGASPAGGIRRTLPRAFLRRFSAPASAVRLAKKSGYWRLGAAVVGAVSLVLGCILYELLQPQSAEIAENEGGPRQAVEHQVRPLTPARPVVPATPRPQRRAGSRRPVHRPNRHRRHLRPAEDESRWRNTAPICPRSLSRTL